MRLAEVLGLNSCLAPLHMVPRFDTALNDHFFSLAPGFPEDDQEGILFIGSPGEAERAIYMEEHGCDSHEAARIYGYPSCCAQAYLERVQKKGSFWVESFLSDLNGIIRAPWQMNRMGRLFAPGLSLLPDYFPCSLHCKGSLALALSYEALLEETGLGILKQQVKEHLARPVLCHSGCLYWLEPIEQGYSPFDCLSLRVLQRLPFSGSACDADILNIADTPDGLLIKENGLIDRNANLILFE